MGGCNACAQFYMKNFKWLRQRIKTHHTDCGLTYWLTTDSTRWAVNKCRVVFFSVLFLLHSDFSALNARRLLCEKVIFSCPRFDLQPNAKDFIVWQRRANKWLLIWLSASWYSAQWSSINQMIDCVGAKVWKCSLPILWSCEIIQ